VYAVKSWFKSWVISFTFQAYTLPHTMNYIFVSLFNLISFSYLNFKAVLARLAQMKASTARG
jgi:hypothetical protein